jgi:hypothetical protein
MRPRSLDRFAVDQNTTLVIVILGVVCLLAGIVIRSLRAEWKREREEAANPPPPETGGGPVR